ncbi:uncharacterized protein LOC125037037 [Penaeus chinensis]|uniref:uncharacterized protein LOC125037037 n=1 Tax=Penaeus chinensis TaxID=139456 RepID=UPI001FB742F4|nr:uncharacterized protein LOC125037037 [Penaeus chinensis]XP_047485962.1 uncharacterized protein LOC125037037 [Penaeus chinensis]
MTTAYADLEFLVLREEHLEDVIRFAKQHYFPREPLCSGLSVGAVDPREGTRMGDDIRKCLASGLSIGAFDRTSRDLVGIRLAYTCTKDDEAGEGDAGPSPACELEAMYKRDDLVWDSVGLFDAPGVEKILVMFLVGVRSDYGRRGIAKKMVELTIERGRAAGCHEARVIASNIFTQALFSKLGFTTRFTLDLTSDPDIDVAAMGNTTKSCLMSMKI